MTEEALATMTRMPAERVRTMILAVQNLQKSTPLRKTIVSGGTMRVLAALPQEYTAYNVVVDMKGKVIIPIDCMMGSKTSGAKETMWVWVIFAEMARKHIHDKTCENPCQLQFDATEDSSGSNGTFIAVFYFNILET
jgi:hypothetical protein